MTLKKDAFDTCRPIIERANKLIEKHGGNVEPITVALVVVNALDQGYIDVDRLMQFPDHDFAHDIGGLIRHTNPRTSQLENCFLPRSAPGQ